MQYKKAALEEEEARRHSALEHFYWRKQAAIATVQLRISRRVGRLSVFTSVLTFISVLGLLVTIYFTKVQVTQSRTQIEQSTKALRIDQRAWVELGLASPTVALKLIPGKWLTVDIKRLNIGKTIARNLIVRTKVEKLMPDQAPAFAEQLWGLSEVTTFGVLYPNEQIERKRVAEAPGMNSTLLEILIDAARGPRRGEDR